MLWISIESMLPENLARLCANTWKIFASHALHLVLLGSAERRGDGHSTVPKWTWYYTFKLQAVHNFLAAHAHEAPGGGQRTLVVHADASDNILFGDQKELVECIGALFCERGYDPEYDVLFVGERGLWPESPHYTAASIPTVGDYRFLK